MNKETVVKRGVGRPPTPKETRLGDRVTFLCTKRQYAELVVQSNTLGRSVSETARLKVFGEVKNEPSR